MGGGAADATEDLGAVALKVTVGIKFGFDVAFAFGIKFGFDVAFEVEFAFGFGVAVEFEVAVEV